MWGYSGILSRFLLNNSARIKFYPSFIIFLLHWGPGLLGTVFKTFGTLFWVGEKSIQRIFTPPKNQKYAIFSMDLVRALNKQYEHVIV